MEAEIEAAGGGRLVILELGVGRRVEVVREECECVVADVVAKGGTATLVRIGPDVEPTWSAGAAAAAARSAEAGGPQTRPPGGPRLLCVRATARQALCKLEGLLH